MNATDYNDSELIKLYLNGDKSKFEILINRHKNQIYSYIFLMVKNQALAEDIFQDTFIKIIKSLHTNKYKDNGKFVSWAMRIAHNLIIDYFRKAKHIKTIAEGDTELSLFNIIGSSDRNSENDIIRNEKHHEIKELIQKLPKEQLEIIKLRYYFDMSFKDIANITNVSINTALGRMRYAILNLRKMMEQQSSSVLSA